MEETFGFENDFTDPKQYDPYRGLSETSSEFSFEEAEQKISNLEKAFYTICKKSGLNEEVSVKLSKTLKDATIKSMISGSTSLAFLVPFLGISAFSLLAIRRIDELKEKELRANPTKKKSIENRYKKILSERYRR